MKKHIITLIFALGLGLNLSAQGDGFFTSDYSEFRTTTDEMGDMPALFGHGHDTNQSAPVGSGLLILGGLALAYGIRKKN
ncbi:MAG: LPXTG cell wall anchor domain-containing protein [Bacteroidales bacterium]|nr:LPXTG cell wall anchor domain-containing protein [Bacteroidales bacterium]